MTQWTLNVPDETDRRVRQYLERTGEAEGDLSKFVDSAVRQAMFWRTVESIQERNKDLSPEEAQRIADEAVADARANRP